MSEAKAVTGATTPLTTAQRLAIEGLAAAVQRAQDAWRLAVEIEQARVDEALLPYREACSQAQDSYQRLLGAIFEDNGLEPPPRGAKVLAKLNGEAQLSWEGA